MCSNFTYGNYLTANPNSALVRPSCQAVKSFVYLPFPFRTRLEEDDNIASTTKCFPKRFASSTCWNTYSQFDLSFVHLKKRMAKKFYFMLLNAIPCLKNVISFFSEKMFGDCLTVLRSFASYYAKHFIICLSFVSHGNR